MVTIDLGPGTTTYRFKYDLVSNVGLLTGVCLNSRTRAAIRKAVSSILKEDK